MYIYNKHNNNLFPNNKQPAEFKEFTLNKTRMGQTPFIEAVVTYPSCLDNLFDNNQYIIYQDEKYWITQKPTSAKNNKDLFYTHKLIFLHERYKLDNIIFTDAVTTITPLLYRDRVRSNNTKMSFYGDIHELAARINDALFQANMYDKDAVNGYCVVVEEGVTSEPKELTFDNAYISQVILHFYNTFNIPYAFIGKKCVVGYGTGQTSIISVNFAYGEDKGLLAIEKANQNFKIINRITGTGGNQNIPFYYPNDSPMGTYTVSGIGQDRVTIDPQLLQKHIPNPIGKILTYTQAVVNLNKTFNTQGITLQSSIGHKSVQYDFDTYIEAPAGTPINLFTSLDIEGEYDELKAYLEIKDAESLQPFVYNTIDNQGYTHAKEMTFSVAQMSEFYNKELFFYMPDKALKIRLHVFLAKNYVAYNDTINVKITNQSTVNNDKTNTAGFIYDDNRGNIKFIPYDQSGIIFHNKADIALDTEITINDRIFIPTSQTLLPSVYRASMGANRFINAIDNLYDDENGNKIFFTNPYTDENRMEGALKHEEIFPTIEHITNTENNLFSEIADVAFDDQDSDEVGDGTKPQHPLAFNGQEEYKHSWFYIKLNTFDGDFGFNLFDYALEQSPAYIEMKTGDCAACKFEIGVKRTEAPDKSHFTFSNPVLTDNNGNLLRGNFQDKVSISTHTPQQQDTSKNQVWIAVKKETSTFGMLMPNKERNHKPKKGDKFVITGIKMPKKFYLAAEDRLTKALIKDMKEQNEERFSFQSLVLSRIYLLNHPQVMNNLNENAQIFITYNNIKYPLYVSSYKVKVSQGEPLEVQIELVEKFQNTQGGLQQIVQKATTDAITTTQQTNIRAMLEAAKVFVRKDIEDVVNQRLRLAKGLIIGDNNYDTTQNHGIDHKAQAHLKSIKLDDELISENYQNDIQGTRVAKDKIQTETLSVTKKAIFNNLELRYATFSNGDIYYSLAGAKITQVQPITQNDETITAYKCFINTDDGTMKAGNPWKTGDIAICQVSNIKTDNDIFNTSTRYYARQVIGWGSNYVILSNQDGEKDSKYDDPPLPQDNIMQRGNIDIPERQYFKIDRVTSASTEWYYGVNSFKLNPQRMIVAKISPQEIKLRAEKIKFLATANNTETTIDTYIDNHTAEIKLEIDRQNTYDNILIKTKTLDKNTTQLPWFIGSILPTPKPAIKNQLYKYKEPNGTNGALQNSIFWNTLEYGDFAYYGFWARKKEGTNAYIEVYIDNVVDSGITPRITSNASYMSIISDNRIFIRFNADVSEELRWCWVKIQHTDTDNINATLNPIFSTRVVHTYGQVEGFSMSTNSEAPPREGFFSMIYTFRALTEKIEIAKYYNLTLEPDSFYTLGMWINTHTEVTVKLLSDTPNKTTAQYTQTFYNKDTQGNYTKAQGDTAIIPSNYSNWKWVWVRWHTIDEFQENVTLVLSIGNNSNNNLPSSQYAKHVQFFAPTLVKSYTPPAGWSASIEDAVTEEKLKNTGMTITKDHIVITADTLVFENSNGEQTALLDSQGRIKASEFTAIGNGMYTRSIAGSIDMGQIINNVFKTRAAFNLNENNEVTLTFFDTNGERYGTIDKSFFTKLLTTVHDTFNTRIFYLISTEARNFAPLDYLGARNNPDRQVTARQFESGFIQNTSSRTYFYTNNTKPTFNNDLYNTLPTYPENTSARKAWLENNANKLNGYYADETPIQNNRQFNSATTPANTNRYPIFHIVNGKITNENLYVEF